MMRECKVRLSRIPEEVIGRVISRVRTVDNSRGKTVDTEVVVDSTEVEEVEERVVCRQDSSLVWLVSLCVVEIGIEAKVPGLEKDEWKERQ